MKLHGRLGLARKRKKQTGEAGKFRKIPLEDILETLKDASTGHADVKRIKKELHRRKSMGVKVEIPYRPAGAKLKEATPASAGEVRCWMSSHLYGFRGQIMGLVFLGSEGVRSLIVMYVLDPDRMLKATFVEQTSIRRFKELLGSITGSLDNFAAVEPGFGLGTLFEILERVDEESQTWEGNRNQALAILDQHRDLLKTESGHPASAMVKPSEEIRRNVARDSSYLKDRDVFAQWKPEVDAIKVLVEKLNVVSGGKISTSRENKMSAMNMILFKEVDVYFNGEKRENIARSLMDNAYVALFQKDGTFARECGALSEIVADSSVAPRDIGFLVHCMRGCFEFSEMGADGKPVQQQEEGRGGIIIPGAREPGIIEKV